MELGSLRGTTPGFFSPVVSSAATVMTATAPASPTKLHEMVLPMLGATHPKNKGNWDGYQQLCCKEAFPVWPCKHLQALTSIQGTSYW